MLLPRHAAKAYESTEEEEEDEGNSTDLDVDAAVGVVEDAATIVLTEVEDS